MGDTELANLGLSMEYRERLWKAEVDNEIEVDDGIRGIVMSWNCVAPAGENYFEVDALRGPTVVEFAIATPRPFGHSTVTRWSTTCAPVACRWNAPPTPRRRRRERRSVARVRLTLRGR